MKKLLILFLAVGMLTACNNKKGKEGDKTDKDTTTVTKDKDTKDADGKEPEGDKTTDKTDDTVTGWPQKDKDDFLTSCIAEAFKSSQDRPLSEHYCECMLGKMEIEYPDVNRAATLTTEEIQAVLLKYRDGCLGGR